MLASQNVSIPAGWVGGFAQSNPKFAYPNPDLSSLPLLDNMDNIDKLQRMQQAEWPEFSWETEKGNANTRLFQMFSPYISRIGYTDEGRVYSIICPQQGVWVPGIGTLNIEVTVTSQRGWVDEPNTENNMYADMTVEGKIWFSPDANQNAFIKLLWNLFSSSNLPFPSTKAKAIVVTTHQPGNPHEPIFPVRKGETSLFESPDFAKHPEAYGNANLGVEIGPITPTNNELVDTFNQLVMDLFNLGSGNILQSGNILTWNIWISEPGLVDQDEWRAHAEKWRESIDVTHHAPTGDGTRPRYFDGTYFSAEQALIDEKIQEIIDWLKQHFMSFGTPA